METLQICLNLLESKAIPGICPFQLNITFQSRIISSALKLCNTVVSKSCQVSYALALVQTGFLLLSILNTCLCEEPKYLP